MGVLIHDKTAERRTIPNLFYEASLMHYLGKELIMVSHKTRRPSDLESVEWITFESKPKFRRALEDRLKRIFPMRDYYERVANVETDAGNYLTAIEYLKKAILIEPDDALIKKLGDANAVIKSVSCLSKDYLNNLHFIDTVAKWRRQ